MKIDYLTPDKEVLAELGRRLAHIRKQFGYSQAKLAEEAGIGVATIRRIETGKASQIESWIKLMKSLRMTAHIDSLLPEKFNSPKTEALLKGKRRIRKKSDLKKPVWGDEQA